MVSEMPQTAQDTAQAERVRNLMAQIGELGESTVEGVMFIDSSPGREPVTLYAIATGEPLSFPAYMIPAQLRKRDNERRFIFTADPTGLPEYKLGNVKCFLHPQAPERSVVEAIGLGGKTCVAAHLANLHSKRLHEQHRHKQERAAYQEFLDSQKEDQRELDRRHQLQATLAMAGRLMPSSVPTAADEIGITEVPIPTVVACDICGKVLKTPLALAGHQRTHKTKSEMPRTAEA